MAITVLIWPIAVTVPLFTATGCITGTGTVITASAEVTAAAGGGMVPAGAMAEVGATVPDMVWGWGWVWDWATDSLRSGGGMGAGGWEGWRTAAAIWGTRTRITTARPGATTMRSRFPWTMAPRRWLS